MDKDEIAEKILAGLEKQKFADWYTSGNFDHWITGETSDITRARIVEDIKKLFNLN